MQDKVRKSSNPSYGTNERKIGCKNTTLIIVEKIGESKVFEREIRERERERERERRKRIRPKTTK